MARLRWLSNAGVVLEFSGAALLADGLYTVFGPPFSNVPEPLLAGVRADYIAVTHTHQDHLDWRKLDAYLAAHPVKGLLLPPRVRGERHGVPETVMKGPGGCVDWPELQVAWRRTPHLERARPEHHSFLVKGDGLSVLVAGDAMPSPELGALFAQGKPDVALVTPLLLQTEEGRALVRAGRVLIYHLSAPEDDQWGLRRMAARQAERWGATVLAEPGQTVELG